MKPLCLTVRDVAALAAVRDTVSAGRSRANWASWSTRSRCSPRLRRVMDVKQIRVGRAWAADQEGRPRGPVASPGARRSSTGTASTFLEQACRKAGLPPHAWKDEATDIFRFSALVFGGHRQVQSVIPEQMRLPRPTGWPIPPGPDSPSPSAGPF